MSIATVVKIESLAAEEPVEIIKLDGGMVTIGRDPENGIVIDSDSVSRRHCSVFEVNGYWFFRDFDSTNGSWVNGVKVGSQNLRLLRDGDLIILSNFPMRISEVGRPKLSLDSEPSLLVFSEDKFELEYPLSSSSAFTVGGPDATLVVTGGENTPILRIEFAPPRIELTAFAAVQVMVNGASVGGTTALSDRDEVDVAGLKIVINDPASAQATKESRMKAAMMNNHIGRNIERGISAPIARPGAQSEIGLDWESETSRRRELLGRKFIFGTNPSGGTDAHNVTSTMSFRPSGGFEVSASHRFSRASLDAAVEEGKPGLSEGVLGVIGFIMFVLILAAIGYFIWML